MNHDQSSASLSTSFDVYFRVRACTYDELRHKYCSIDFSLQVFLHYWANGGK